MDLLATAVVVAVLAAVAFAIVRALGLEQPWLQPWAILRAVVQLGLLSVVLTGVIEHPLWVAGFLVLMLLAASWNVHRRLRLGAGAIPVFAGILLVATAVPVSLAFGLGALPPEPRYLLALGGIVLGNAMTVLTLMGRTMHERLIAEHELVEGWLALGATPRRAARDAMRAAASTALVPSTDQTRTTGIVTLPGAFVGALFGGAAPVEAAAFQLVVLAGVLAAGAVTVLLVTWRWGAPKVVPVLPR